jgi:predicted transcriptional regulator
MSVLKEDKLVRGTRTANRRSYVKGAKDKILEVIQSNSRISVLEIANIVYGNNGNVRNIAAILTKLKYQGLIKRVNKGEWSVVTNKPNRLDHGMRRKMILKAMRDNPGISVSKLSKIVYGRKNPAIGSQLDILLIKGLVKHPSRGV